MLLPPRTLRVSSWTAKGQARPEGEMLPRRCSSTWVSVAWTAEGLRSKRGFGGWEKQEDPGFLELGEAGRFCPARVCPQVWEGAALPAPKTGTLPTVTVR